MCNLDKIKYEFIHDIPFFIITLNSDKDYRYISLEFHQPKTLEMLNYKFD